MRDVDYLTKQRRRLTAAMRAQFRLKQRIEALEWEETVLRPALTDLENRIEAGEQVEIKLLEAKNV